MAPTVPTFAAPIVIGIFLGLLPVTWIVAYKFRDAPTLFLLAAIWLRYLMAALHEYTYPSIMGGLSLNAVSSVAVTALGFMIVDKRLLRLKALAGIYLMVAAVIVSTIINGGMGVIESLAKWGYLIVVTLTAYEAFQRHGAAAVLLALLTLFFPPLALQIVSVFAGMGKGSDIIGEICYIGGYNHESAFSVIALTFLCCACFLERERVKVSIVCIALATGALLLANYRTSILAAAPMLIATFYIAIVRRFSPSERSTAAVLLTLSGAFLLYIVGIAMQERFVDLFTIVSNSADLIKPPEFYTEADADLLSGRLIIWSNYITAYMNGSIVNYAFGFGPDAWEGVFPLYAHNTFVSVLYEAGAFGLVSMLLLFAWSFKRAMNSASNARYVIIGAHLGFLVLNLATMPLWMIEGNILLALILAYTLHMQASRQFRSRNPAVSVRKAVT